MSSKKLHKSAIPKKKRLKHGFPRQFWCSDGKQLYLRFASIGGQHPQTSEKWLEDGNAFPNGFFPNFDDENP